MSNTIRGWFVATAYILFVVSLFGIFAYYHHLYVLQRDFIVSSNSFDNRDDSNEVNDCILMADSDPNYLFKGHIEMGITIDCDANEMKAIMEEAIAFTLKYGGVLQVKQRQYALIEDVNE